MYTYPVNSKFIQMTRRQKLLATEEFSLYWKVYRMEGLPTVLQNWVINWIKNIAYSSKILVIITI